MENQPRLKNFNLNIILTCKRDKATARMGLSQPNMYGDVYNNLLPVILKLYRRAL